MSAQKPSSQVSQKQQSSKAIPESNSFDQLQADYLLAISSLNEKGESGFRKVISKMEEIPTEQRPLSISRLLAKSYLTLARFYFERERFALATAQAQTASEIYEQLEQFSECVAALELEAMAAHETGLTERALDKIRAASRMADQIGDDLQKGLLILCEALWLSEIGELRRSSSRWRDGLQLVQEQGTSFELVRALKTAAQCAARCEDRDAQFDCLQQLTQVQEALLFSVQESEEVSDVVETEEPVQEPTLKVVDSNNTTSPGEEHMDQRIQEVIDFKDNEIRLFIRKAAHDMKEPLRMISSFGGLIKRQYSEVLGEGGNEFLDIVLDANTRMSSLLSKLHEYVKVGLTEIDPAPIDLNDVVTLASNDLKDQIEEKGATIESSALPTVLAHREYISQMFRHLIENAVKFSEGDAPKIELGAKEEGDEDVLYIRDQGIGIEPEHFEKIFEIFQKLHSRAEYPGSGVGLATVAKVAEFYGGRTWVESNPGKGSTFYVAFPKRA
jgi:signal transduction histidine kinase